MIPGEKNLQKNKEWKTEDYKKLEKIRVKQWFRESAAEEKKSDSNKAPLIPTGINTKTYGGERLHNLNKPHGFDGHCDDEEYSSTQSERTPNDDRSVAMNPNNQACKSSMDNRSVQMNR